MSNSLYSVVYADPPYQFKNYSDSWHKANAKSRWVGNVYDTMAVEDIKALDVGSVSAKDSVLLIWATFPRLPESLDIMKSWGYTYKTNAFTWIKTNRKSGTPFLGLGNYTRANAEICLLGTRGKPLPRMSHKVRQVVISPVREHSRKPDEVRDRIVELFGDVPRLEMFARGAPPEGWDAWGDEVNSDVDIQHRLTNAG
jgi:N6-adenosine-specific RNA methylase IME4